MPEELALRRVSEWTAQVLALTRYGHSIWKQFVDAVGAVR